MVYGVNTFAANDAIIVGTIRYRVHYSFRQRVADQNAPVLNQSISFRMDDHGRIMKSVTDLDETENC